MIDHLDRSRKKGIRRTVTDEFIVESKVRRFLVREAGLLDDGRLREWLELFTNDAEYKVPRRITKEKRGDGEFSEKIFYFDDTKKSLKTRVERFETEYAWSEIPPTRTVRIVSNVRVSEDRGDELKVKSNLLLNFNRGDRTNSGAIAARRHDTLRRQDDQFRIAKRRALMNVPIATTPLSFFL